MEDSQSPPQKPSAPSAGNTKLLFVLQVSALLLACVFATVFNSHPKQQHVTQIIGAVGVLSSLVTFVLLTLVRVTQATKQRASRVAGPEPER